jgi:acyltransferase
MRINWLDRARGIAIILVIIGHANFPEEIRTIVYAFHMPLFFFLSGFLLLKKEENFNLFFVKKVKSLIIPYVSYNIILIIFYWLLWIISKSQDLYQNIFCKLIAIPMAIRIDDIYESRLWFLPCLFISNVLICALFKLFNKSLVALFAAGLIFSLIGIGLNIKYDKLILPWSIDASLMICIFIIVAIIIREKNLLNIILKKKFVVLYFLLYILFTYLNFLYNNNKRIDIYEADYGNYLYFYITSFTGIFIVLKIAYNIGTNKMLEFFGKNSLIIYVTHYIYLTFAFQIVKYIPLIYNDTITKIISGLIVTLLCIIASIPTSKIINRFLPWSIGRI